MQILKNQRNHPEIQKDLQFFILFSESRNIIFSRNYKRDLLQFKHLDTRGLLVADICSVICNLAATLIRNVKWLCLASQRKVKALRAPFAFLDFCLRIS